MKRLIYLFFTLFILSFIFAHVILAVTPVPHKTLKIALNTSNLSKPRIVYGYVEQLNPEHYVSTPQRYYYKIQLLDANKVVIFEGLAKRQAVRIVDPYKGVSSVEQPTDSTPGKLTLNLPLYEEAQTMKIYDETGAEVLSADVTSYVQSSGQRFAECNICGYCLHKDPPDGIDACMKCLYPGLTLDDSLRIDPEIGQPPGRAPGKYYSQLGCIDFGVASLGDISAPGGLVNFLLSSLLFPLTGILALLGVIYGSYLLITAQGNPEQIQRGRMYITGSIIGALFAYGAVLIVQNVGGSILKIPGMN